MPLLSDHPIRLQPYFGYRSQERLVIGARALRSASPGFEPAGRWQAFRTMLAQFASREAAGVEVTLEIEDARGKRSRHGAATDREGFVRFDIPLGGGFQLGPHPVWETVALPWANREGAQSLEGHVLAPGATSRLAVISDIDDTIIETGITGGFRALARNWRRILAELPDERIAAPGADLFYAALGGGAVAAPDAVVTGMHIAATHRPFFYVSSSPWNLFSYLVAFQRRNDLPLGPLLLRDWGLNRATFGSASHGGHKRAMVDAILAMYPQLRFALIGDDTQGDLTAYAGAVKRHPERVAAVFIRKVAGEDLSGEERSAKAAIEGAGVPLWLGEDFAAARDMLQTAGIAPGDETEKILRAVERAPTRNDDPAG